LFRPPYGRIKARQAKKIPDALQTDNGKIIMWDVLSADFDSAFSPEQCLQHVLDNANSGSIIVFHDSEKAFNNLKYALPKTLESLKEEGFNFKKIEL
jgi:peptidoglycan/xylan/chitin deacetylase (PgdA/CDA1 family)